MKQEMSKSLNESLNAGEIKSSVVTLELSNPPKIVWMGDIVFKEKPIRLRIVNTHDNVNVLETKHSETDALGNEIWSRIVQIYGG